MISLLYSWDIFILQLINLSYHNFFLDQIALMISNMGIIYFWIIVSILLYIFGGVKGKYVAKKMIIILFAVTVITQAIKYIVIRPRPYEESFSLILLSTGTDPSFPSGHTVTSTAMAYLLSREYNKLFLVIPFVVAISRLYIGVHYPSDVMGGFILAMAVTYLLNYLIEKYKLLT